MGSKLQTAVLLVGQPALVEDAPTHIVEVMTIHAYKDSCQESSPVWHLTHAVATHTKMQTVLLDAKQKRTKVLLALPTCGAAFACDAFALPQAPGALSGRCRMFGVCEPRPEPRPDLEPPCRPGCSHPSSALALLSAGIKLWLFMSLHLEQDYRCQPCQQMSQPICEVLHEHNDVQCQQTSPSVPASFPCCSPGLQGRLAKIVNIQILK